MSPDYMLGILGALFYAGFFAVVSVCGMMVFNDWYAHHRSRAVDAMLARPTLTSDERA